MENKKTTYIVFLKGINVGGHRKIPMADLRALLTESGFDSVKSYIQSGNIILKTSENNVRKIETIISNVILNQFGFQVSVLVKKRKELQQIFNACPFSESQIKTSYFILLHNKPKADLIALASKKVYPNEQYIITSTCIYFYAEAGFGKSKFNVGFFEKKLDTFATARNYNTMLKLLSLSA